MTKAGQTIYARRKIMVEPVFGQIKHAQGFRQFLLRGAEKVRSEWALVCTTHSSYIGHVRHEISDSQPDKHAEMHVTT